MDTRDGTILTEEQVREKIRNDPTIRSLFRQMSMAPSRRQRRLGRVGRNDSCPCGSGKKFKKCCLMAEVKEKTDA